MSAADGTMLEDGLTRTLITAAIVLIFGVIVLNQVAALGATGSATAAGDLVGNEQIDPAVYALESVTDSLGTALQLDGSEDAGIGGDIPQPPIGDAELCTFASVGNTSKNATVVSADGELVIQYQGNRTEDHWVGVRYNRSTTETTEVTFNATNRTELRHVCLRERGTNLTLNVNGTESTVTIGNSPADEFDSNTTGFNGTVEETRLYETDLTGNQRSFIRSNPTSPLSSGPTPSARVLFDTRKSIGSSFGSVTIYFADTTGSVTGGTVVDGVDARSSVDADDVTISDDGRQIDAVQGGDLEGAPVAFITYTGAGLIGDTGQAVLATIEAAMTFAPVAIIVMLAGAIMSMLREGRR